MATNVLLAAPGGLAAACGNNGATNFTLDSTGVSADSVALMFIAPKTGTINAVGFRINSVTGTASAANVSIQGQTSGAPSGSNWDASSTVSVTGIGTAPYTATTYNWVTITPDAPDVTAGDKLAAVITLTTASTSVAITTGLDGAVNGSLAGSPHIRTNTNAAGWVTTDDSMPAVAVRYSDGEILYGCIPYVSALTSTTFGNDSTPDEKGVYWDAEAAVTVYGADIAFRADGTGSAWDVHVYVGSGNPAASITLSLTDEDVRATASMGRLVVAFSTPVSVPAGSRARITIRPTVAAATGTVRVIEWTFADSDSREAVVGRLARCDRSDAGSWNDTTTQYIQITPVLAETGGLLTHPGMTGGVRG
jgi:hypothetical protein